MNLENGLLSNMSVWQLSSIALNLRGKSLDKTHLRILGGTFERTMFRFYRVTKDREPWRMIFGGGGDRCLTPNTFIDPGFKEMDGKRA